MSYIRTKEIKEKQSKKMKEKVKEYDWLSIIEKRNNTIKENNIKVGRKKGDGPAKRGTEKPCCFCKKLFYVTQKNLNKRKYCSRECMHSDPEYKLKLKNVDKTYMKSEKYANATRDPNRPKYKQYYRDVYRLSEENYVKYKDIINPNGYPRTLAGVEGGYQLDHKVSIKYGFDNKIEPHIIASVDNLQMLTWRENIKKGK